MKNIIFISDNDHVPWGGSEVLWTEIASRILSAESYEVGISPRKWRNQHPRITALLDSRAQDFRRTGDRPVPTLKKIANRLLPWKMQWKPQKEDRLILKKAAPDFAVLSLGDHNSGVAWMKLFRELDIPYALIVQLVKEGHIPSSDEQYYFDLKRGYQRAKKVLCVSKDNRHLLEKQFATCLPNTITIHNPIPDTSDIPEFPELGTANLAVVASLNVNHKGQDVLLDVLRQDKWKARDLSVNFYGTGPHERMLRELAAHWDITNISFEGHKSIKEIWSRNHIFLLPSRMEGLSLAFLEACYYKRASIVTNLGDSSSFIADNVSGFLVKAPTAELLDETMERAWHRRADWKAMGQLSRHRLEDLIVSDPVESATQIILDAIETS